MVSSGPAASTVFYYSFINQLQHSTETDWEFEIKYPRLVNRDRSILQANARPHVAKITLLKL